MSKFAREAIIPLCAVIGSQLPGLFVQSQPGQSSASCTQWVDNAIDGASYNLQRTFNPPKVPEGLTEGEYNTYREIYKTDDIRVASPTAVVPTAVTPPTVDRSQAAAVPPVHLPTSEDDRLLDAEIARDRGLTLEQYYRSFDNGGY